MSEITKRPYNGWNNYATWRIYSENFADFDFDNEIYENNRDAGFCQNFVKSSIFDNIPNGLAKNYANAFLAQVDWQEISEHLKED